MTDKYDVIIVGAGIIGAAVLFEYQKRNPQHKVLLLEKESGPASHQTGRNSGVIHAGVYYPPNSLKAQFCREGLEDTFAWCQRFSLPVEQCGKLIVATDDDEVSKLDALHVNCEANDLKPERIGAATLGQMEPNITGKEAILVRATGITDYTAITHSLLQAALSNANVQVQYGATVMDIVENDGGVSVVVACSKSTRRAVADRVICCAGVHADGLISLQGLTPTFKIMPFKGEYYRLSPTFNQISERLIYPVPNPDMPFLGVHLTKMIGGYCTVGPNAVLAPGREAYDALPSVGELLRTVSYKGLWRLLWRYKSSVAGEIRSSLSKAYYADLVQRYCPSVTAEAFHYYRPGIRAQAVSKDGQLISDFAFVTTERVLHVGNAPSPAATSAMPIARAILNKLDNL